MAKIPSRVAVLFGAALACGGADVLAQDGWPPSALYGRVVSMLHEGVPAAEVWVTDHTGAVLQRTVADGDGYYQLRRLPIGPLEVHAKGEGKVRLSMTIPAQGAVRAATVQLEDGAPLHGDVRWPDGTPVADADVLVTADRLQPGSVWWAECTTDAGGRWTIEGAPLRPMTVRVFAPGFDVVEQQVDRGRAARVATTVPKRAATARRVEVRGLPEGAAAQLVCMSPTNPTHISGPWLPRRARRASVGADGAATVWSLPFRHEVRVEADGMRSMPVCVRCGAGDERALSFELTPLPAKLVSASTAVRGRVVDELGRPLAGVAVVASYEGELRGPVRSDDDGAFSIDVPTYAGVLFRIGLLPGARYVGDPRAVLGGDGVSWLSKNVDPDGVLRLDTTQAATVRGQLLRPDGLPWMAADVRLVLQGARAGSAAVSTATDSAGRIAVTGLPPGTYRLTASSPSGLEGAATLELRPGEVTAPTALEFGATGEVRGIVKDADGRPVPSAAFYVIGNSRRRARIANVWTVADRHGRFRIPHLPEGAWLAGGSSGGRVILMRDGAQFDVEAGRVVEVEVPHPR